MRRLAVLNAAAVSMILLAAPAARGQAVADAATFAIADGSFTLAAPAEWKRVPPKSRIVETEFEVPGAGDAAGGRLTVMGAGGTVAANIDRWYGQFTQPDGSATKDKASTKSVNLAGCAVTLVDIPGTFKDMPGGPFAGGQAVDRPDYRMLAAIIATPEAGNYFLKLTGPAATVAAHADGFRKMVEGIVPAAK